MHHPSTGARVSRPAVLLSSTLVLLAGCTSVEAPPRVAPAPSVQGAGATFPAPLYQRWFTHLLVRKGLTIGYEPMGSCEGEDQLDQGLVDFAGSDPSTFNGTQTSLTSGRWLRIPMVAGAIAVAYNNPDCRLRLSRD
ncbi:MAG: Synechococcus phage, partial [Cyanobacteriota bacterium]